jgi:hypothetical protein
MKPTATKTPPRRDTPDSGGARVEREGYPLDVRVVTAPPRPSFRACRSPRTADRRTDSAAEVAGTARRAAPQWARSVPRTTGTEAATRASPLARA